MTKHLWRTLTMWVGLCWDTSPCRQMVWRAGLVDTGPERTLWLKWAGSFNHLSTSFCKSGEDRQKTEFPSKFLLVFSGETCKSRAPCWLSYLRSWQHQHSNITCRKPTSSLKPPQNQIKYLQGDSVLAMHLPSIHVCILALSIFGPSKHVAQSWNKMVIGSLVR